HHKKAVIIDNCVIAGSSNLGYKSLEVGADNEVNFVVDNSETFVQRTWAIFNDDILHSVRRTDFSLSTNDYVKTGIHRSIAFLVG
ncbi:MAG TPA: phospholipase D-like domain-containing protein, partial [Rhabdochlamydiaceae bacterium]|nr:phospholipase D-like domain-containing protein [Rhabdochlamydiaceae bacterium]